MFSCPRPVFLEQLMTNQDLNFKNFMYNIRSYNSVFLFTSLVAQIKEPRGYGPNCFRIHGLIYYRTLHLTEGEQRKYAQLYILNPNEVTRQRLSIAGNVGCKKVITNHTRKFICEKQ